MKITNWDKWQTFRKDRGTPPWIKIYRNLLTNEQWVSLTDTEKGHLVSIWILAADKNGIIPDNPSMIQRMAMLDKKPNLNKFIELGFMTTTCQPLANHKKISPRLVDAPEKRRVETEKSREDESRAEQTIVPLPRDRALEVFQCWQSTLNHPKSVFDKDRRALIVKWLNSYDVDYLKKAIHGCSVTPFNMGENDRGQVYDQLKLIFKNADQIDRFVNNSDSPPTGNVKTIEQFTRESNAQAERVMQSMGMLDDE